MRSLTFKVKWGIAVAALSMLAVLLGSTSSLPVTASPAAAVATYKAKCAACHGVDGSGNTVMGKQMKLRDLRSAEAQKLTDAKLQAIIGKGKEKMPAFAGLGADQVKQLVAHVRELAKK